MIQISWKSLNSKDGIGKLGTILKDDGGFAQARWLEANGSTITTSIVILFDPTTLFMAATLMSIEKRLGDIQETQQEILDFLLRMVDRLYNQSTEILFDKDNIYLCQSKKEITSKSLKD